MGLQRQTERHTPLLFVNHVNQEPTATVRPHPTEQTTEPQNYRSFRFIHTHALLSLSNAPFHTLNNWQIYI